MNVYHSRIIEKFCQVLTHMLYRRRLWRSEIDEEDGGFLWQVIEYIKLFSKEGLE